MLVRGQPVGLLGEGLTSITVLRPGASTRITIKLTCPGKAADFMDWHNVTFVDPLKVVSDSANWISARDQVWRWSTALMPPRQDLFEADAVQPRDLLRVAASEG